MMQTFKVGLYYTETGHVNIEANTAEEAEKKIIKCLKEDGLDNVVINCTDREYQVTDVRSLSENKKNIPR